MSPSAGNVATPIEAVTEPLEVLDGGARALGDVQRAGGIRVGQQEREFVAAVPEHEVRVATGPHEAARDPPQDLVAGLVAHRVVDGPEIVEVEHDQAEGGAIAHGALEVVLEGAVIEEPGQGVGLGADLDRREDLRVLQRDGHLRREQLDQVELLGRERVAHAEPLDGQHTDGAGTSTQGHDDEAAVDGPRGRGSG